ncbi:MAG: hypothetical protein RBQ99_09820, partial [Trichlorobacter sp.]|nr:hypothetical protein [Trichlorobacter sp.]
MTNQIQTHRISTLEEHSNLLREALQTAKQRVIISSPFISTHAIKADNVPEQIYKTVGRGVKVSIYIDDLFGQDDQGKVKKGTAEG